MIRQTTNERGAVALITSIIISILLTIIVTGLITLMASELRQASDSEQSVRAYYAAQSGIEDGVQRVISLLPNGRATGTCPAVGTPVPAVPAVGWTCQSITYSGAPKGNLNLPDQSDTIDLAEALTFNKMVLSWDTTPGTVVYPAASGSWNGGQALELAIVEYATAGTSQAGIKLQNILTIPSSGPSSTATLGAIGSNPYSSLCTPQINTTGYHCTLNVTGFTSTANSYIIRLRGRTTGTSYQLDFYNGASHVDVPDGTATIDVTAKAGSVFRRVIYKVPIKNQAASGLDYVLFSDNNICKDYTIIGGTSPGYPCASN